MNGRKRKPLLSGETALAAAFSDMWSEENMSRMEDLGFYADVIKDEAGFLAAVCIHLLDIPAFEYAELIERVPEAVPGSSAYIELRVEIDCAREETDEPIVGLMHVAIVNAVIREYNKTAE